MNESNSSYCRLCQSAFYPCYKIITNCNLKKENGLLLIWFIISEVSIHGGLVQGRNSIVQGYGRTKLFGSWKPEK